MDKHIPTTLAALTMACGAATHKAHAQEFPSTTFERQSVAAIGDIPLGFQYSGRSDAHYEFFPEQAVKNLYSNAAGFGHVWPFSKDPQQIFSLEFSSRAGTSLAVNGTVVTHGNVVLNCDISPWGDSYPAVECEDFDDVDMTRYATGTASTMGVTVQGDAVGEVHILSNTLATHNIAHTAPRLTANFVAANISCNGNATCMDANLTFFAIDGYAADSSVLTSKLDSGGCFVEAGSLTRPGFDINRGPSPVTLMKGHVHVDVSILFVPDQDFNWDGSFGAPDNGKDLTQELDCGWVTPTPRG